MTIAIEVTKKVYKKGPFSDYAEQFLGISDVITHDKIEWSISNVDIQTYAKIDTTQIYVINSNFNGYSDLINLSKEGFLLSINKQIGTYYSDLEIDDNMVIDSELDATLSYGNIMKNDNFKTVYDTIYNEILEDTNFVKIPVVKKQLVEKSIIDQAEELAEQILVLRDDRSALLVGEGDSEYLPDGQALEIMLLGLDKLEEEYMSMFIGKTFTSKQIYYFDYIPAENQLFRQEILCRFSETDGLLDAKNIKGKPVYLEITSENNSSTISEFNYKQSISKRVEKNKEQNTGIVYRIPEKANLRIVYKDNEYLNEDLIIAQYGTNMFLPAKLFLENDYAIEFYPKYGALKSIEKKSNGNE